MSAPPYPPARTRPLDPSPVLSDLRLHQPVSKITLPRGETAWLVTRHADVCAVLRDQRFSVDIRREGHGSIRKQPTPDQLGMGRMDDPDHHHMRRMFNPDFMAESLRGLRPTVRRIVEGEVDAVLAQEPPVDLIPRFAMRIPSLVVCRMLGIDPAEQEYFQSRTATVDGRATSSEDIQRADAELFDFAERLIARNEREPGDNMVGRLLTTSVPDGALSRADLVAQVRVFMMAGHRTTFSQIGLSLLSVLSEPKLFGMMIEAPETIGNAVHELLRYHTVSQDGILRQATEDIEIGGALIGSGDNVVLALSAANRDPGVFPDPDTLDFNRDTRVHLAFGHGPHLCIGRPVVLLELETMLATVTRRIPTLRLAVPAERVRFRDDTYIYGLKELPVSW